MIQKLLAVGENKCCDNVVVECLVVFRHNRCSGFLMMSVCVFAQKLG